jgi:hypothetical protein
VHKLLVVELLLVAGTHGARILGMFPFPARSHTIIHRALMLELATRGHEVTEVTPFPESQPVHNYTNIAVKADLAAAAGGIGKVIAHTFQVIFSVHICKCVSRLSCY